MRSKGGYLVEKKKTYKNLITITKVNEQTIMVMTLRLVFLTYENRNGSWNRQQGRCTCRITSRCRYLPALLGTSVHPFDHTIPLCERACVFGDEYDGSRQVHSPLIRLHVLKILKIASTLYEELYRYEGGMISGYAIDTSNNHIIPTC